MRERQVFGGFIAPKGANCGDYGTAIHLNPSSILKNEAEGPFPILSGFIHSEIMAGGRS